MEKMMVQNKDFFIEDTAEGCYRDITNALLRAGWNRVYSKKFSKTKLRLLLHKRPQFVWTISDRGIDFNDLESSQRCNHFQNISLLTTKTGFCDLLRESAWCCRNKSEMAPRSYNLGDPVQRDEFVEDFRITAATSVLKIVVAAGINDSADDPIVECCIAAVQIYVDDCRGDGQFCEVRHNTSSAQRTSDKDAAKKPENLLYLGQSLQTWNAIIEHHYALVRSLDASPERCVKNRRCNILETIRASVRDSPKVVRIKSLLLGLQRLDPQYSLSGN
jgi:hypothetical protein